MKMLDFFYPKICIGCGSWGNYLCEKCCRSKLYFFQQRCSGCGELSLDGMTHTGCKNQTPLDASISIFIYKGVLKEVVKDVKYRHASTMLSDFINSVRSEIYCLFFPYRYLLRNAVIQPIPLHPLRQKERGFNQAEIIALILSNLLRIPTTSLVQRTKYTDPQTSLSDKQKRIFNIKNAFTVNKNRKGKETILIVDDVYTTGSTCKEVGYMLKSNQDCTVLSFTIAHG